jgi:hypothetical protein
MTENGEGNRTPQERLAAAELLLGGIEDHRAKLQADLEALVQEETVLRGIVARCRADIGESVLTIVPPSEDIPRPRVAARERTISPPVRRRRRRARRGKPIIDAVREIVQGRTERPPIGEVAAIMQRRGVPISGKSYYTAAQTALRRIYGDRAPAGGAAAP